MLRQQLVTGLIAALFLLVESGASWAEDDAKNAQEVVDGAQKTLENFVADPNMTWFRDHVKDAKALFIVPQLLRAGFMFGGSGGTGVLLARDEKTSEWSQPAFYTMGSVSFGLQIGAESSEVVLMVMTQRGLDSMLTTSFKLGGDVSVAAGPVGAGAKAQTSDILSFSRSKGIYGGLSLEGAVIKVRDSLSEAYYGKPVSPRAILITRDVSNAQAAPLVKTVTKVAGGDE